MGRRLAGRPVLKMRAHISRFPGSRFCARREMKILRHIGGVMPSLPTLTGWVDASVFLLTVAPEEMILEPDVTSLLVRRRYEGYDRRLPCVHHYFVSRPCT